MSEDIAAFEELLEDLQAWAAEQPEEPVDVQREIEKVERFIKKLKEKII